MEKKYIYYIKNGKGVMPISTGGCKLGLAPRAFPRDQISLLNASHHPLTGRQLRYLHHVHESDGLCLS